MPNAGKVTLLVAVLEVPNAPAGEKMLVLSPSDGLGNHISTPICCERCAQRYITTAMENGALADLGMLPPGRLLQHVTDPAEDRIYQTAIEKLRERLLVDYQRGHVTTVPLPHEKN